MPREVPCKKCAHWRVKNRTTRLNKLVAMDAPEKIVRTEMALVQQAINTLYNGDLPPKCSGCEVREEPQAVENRFGTPTWKPGDRLRHITKENTYATVLDVRLMEPPESVGFVGCKEVVALLRVESDDFRADIDSAVHERGEWLLANDDEIKLTAEDKKRIIDFADGQ